MWGFFITPQLDQLINIKVNLLYTCQFTELVLAKSTFAFSHQNEQKMIKEQLEKIKAYKKWYPESLRVNDEGTSSTYEFMKKVYRTNQSFRYAEFGIYKGSTASTVHSLFPKSEIHLFDFQETLDDFKLNKSNSSDRYYYYGNSQKYNDSYNWSLIKLIEENQNEPIFDYCFLDGAHTVAIDALNFFLVDRLLKVGGYLDFDDYNWKLRGSSLDPTLIPEINDQYTDEQIDSKQVKMIIDILVKPDPRYEEVVKNKIFRKNSDQYY